jgi:hypothetical protein
MNRSQVTSKVSEKIQDKAKWRVLWSKTVAIAKANQDLRLVMLERYMNEPEWVLRKLSIISEADITREFPTR